MSDRRKRLACKILKLKIYTQYIIVEMSDKDDEQEKVSALQKAHSFLQLGTSSVNLMFLASTQVSTLELKVKNARSTAGLFTPAILGVAQIELNFLLSKECVPVWYRSETSVTRERGEDLYNPRIFILVQVDMLY